MKVAYCNCNTTATGTVQQVPAARFITSNGVSTGPAAALPVVLKTREVQILTPL